MTPTVPKLRTLEEKVQGPQLREKKTQINFTMPIRASFVHNKFDIAKWTFAKNEIKETKEGKRRKKVKDCTKAPQFEAKVKGGRS